MTTEAVYVKPLAKAFGAIFLVAGTAVGAGMLALPITTAPSGFFPSIGLFLFAWIVTTYTALLVLECNLALGGNSNLISMSRKTLGPIGEGVAWIAQLLLLYALVSAYIMGASEIFLGIMPKFTPTWCGYLLVILVFGSVVSSGIKAVDKMNRFFFFGGMLCFILLIVSLCPFINVSRLLRVDSYHAFSPMPIIITSFGFHIVIPSLVKYLNGDARLARICLLVGSCIPLVTYLGWQFVVMGAVPYAPHNGLQSILVSDQPLLAFSRIVQQLTGHSIVATLLRLFSFFAITTSLLGVLLSLWDFLSDGLALHGIPNGKIVLVSLAFGPPLLFTWIVPGGFTVALGYAGIFVSMLHGVLPVAMCWVGRKSVDWRPKYRVRGGKVLMVLSVIFFLCVIGFRAAHSFA